MAKRVPYNFAEARLRANPFLPYLTKHFMSLIPIPTDQVPTMGVDEFGRCYYNPAKFDEWTMEETAGVILHEDLHVMLDHCGRAKAAIGEKAAERNRYIWNLAADCVVNQILDGANVPLPEDKITIHVLNKQYPKLNLQPNETVETYYDQLLEFGDSLPPEPQWGGSAADGQSREWEDGAPESSGVDGLSKHEQEILQRVVAHDIKDRQGNGIGSASPYIDQFVNNILEPKTDPAREIRAKVKYAASRAYGHGNYTWSRPNKRSAPGSMRLPCPIQPVPKFTLIVDTSGSMQEKDRGLALGTVASVLNAYPSESVTVIAGDTSVRECERVFRPEQVKLAGGGGTDMTPLIEDAAKQKPRPDVIVVCSDGETPWPTQPVGCHVVACLTREPKYGDPVPEWMQVIYLEA